MYPASQLVSLRTMTRKQCQKPGVLAALLGAALFWPGLTADALDRVEAQPGRVSLSGFAMGATDFQFGVRVSGTLDQKIEQLQRELRLLEFERDIFPELSREISYSGTNRLMSLCLADLSAKLGRVIPMELGTNDFTAREFVFTGMPLCDVLKYLVAFDDSILDVSRRRLVCHPVGQALALNQSQYDLLELMAHQQFDAVRQILTTNAIAVNSIRDHDQQTLLHLAAWHNQTAIAERLVAQDADINAQDDGGYTPIHEAVRFGSRGCTELLLQHGADLTIADNNGDTPLETACYYGSLDLAQLLVDHGAPVNIFTAAALGMENRIRELLDQSDAEKTGRPGQAAVAPATNWVIALSVNPGRRFSLSSGATPLHWAARGGSVAGARLLVSRGAAISAPDGQGNTPLFWAVEKGRLETARFLVEHGANVNGTNEAGSTPLLTAARNTVAPGLIKYLVEAGADVRVTDSQGENVLHKLAWYGCPDENVATARFLLTAGADLGARNKDGKTPLDILLGNDYRNPDLVKLYQDHSAKPAPASHN